MKTLLRYVFVILCASGLAACGKSPLDQDLAAYAKVNREIRELQDQARNSKVIVAEQYRAQRELENLGTVLEGAKTRLDTLQMQEPQMQKYVKDLRNGYQEASELLRQLQGAVKRRDEKAYKALQAEMTTVEGELKAAENGIFTLAKIKGYRIEQE